MYFPFTEAKPASLYHIMTKTPKNGSSSSTPTPAGGPGGPASVGGSGAPPSVGSTKSEPNDPNDPTSAGGVVTPNTHDGPSGGRSGTPLSADNSGTNASNAEANKANEESNMNGGATASATSSSDGLLCDSNNPEAGGTPAASANVTANNSAPGSVPGSGDCAPNAGDNDDPNGGGAQVKQEDVKPNVSNCSTPLQQNTSGVLPPDTDLFDGFDTKDGGKYFLIIFDREQMF